MLERRPGIVACDRTAARDSALAGGVGQLEYGVQRGPERRVTLPQRMGPARRANSGLLLGRCSKTRSHLPILRKKSRTEPDHHPTSAEAAAPAKQPHLDCELAPYGSDSARRLHSKL